MAREQWKKLGIYIGGTSLIITLLGGMLGLAWAGSSKFTTYDKNIQFNAIKAETATKSVSDKAIVDIGIIADNQAEDRLAIKEIANIVTLLKDKQTEDYQELKDADSESELRSEKISGQFSLILNHMSQQTESSKRTDSAINSIQVDIGKLQTQYETLTKD
jgi:hypothetical protein